VVIFLGENQKYGIDMKNFPHEVHCFAEGIPLEIA
jgi:hypothetical protein